MDNDVTIVVDAKNKTATAFGSAAKGVKTVGEAADIAGRQLAQMDARLDDANVKARRLAEAEERAGAKARDMAERLALMRQQLAESGDESGTLGRKIERLAIDTRVAAEATDDYRRAANRAAAEAREQARAYDRVADNARQAARAALMLGASTAIKWGGKGAADAGAEAGKTFTASLQGALSTPLLGPVITAALLAAAVPAAVAVGAAVGGALLTGVGAAAAGGGLAGAWLGDPAKYESMWSASIDKVQHRWLASSAAFGNELEESLRVVDQMLNNLPIERVLAVSQGFVGPLVGGAAGGASAAANGLADALGKVQPIIDRIGPKLEALGQDAGDAFRMMSMGADQGGQAVSDLLDLIGYLVRATGLMVLGFELAYGALRDLVTGMADFGQSIPVVGDAAGGLWDSLSAGGKTITSTGKMLGDTGDEALNAAWRFGDMIKAGADLAIAALDANDALTELHNTMLASANANLAVAQGWLDLSEGLKDGAKTLDLTKQAGIDNQKVIVDQIGLLEQQRQQAIKTGGGTVEAIDAANAAYNASVARLRAMAIAAGFNAQKVDELIASLGAVQPVTTAAVVTPGLSTALAQGISLGNALNRIDGQVYEAQVIVHYGTAGQSRNVPLRTGGIRGAAAGGPQSGLTEVGEEGRELVRLPTGSSVYPHANAEQYRTMAGWGSGGGGVVLLGSDGSRLGDVLIEIIAMAMRAKGGRPADLGLKIKE